MLGVRLSAAGCRAAPHCGLLRRAPPLNGVQQASFLSTHGPRDGPRRPLVTAAAAASSPPSPPPSGVQLEDAYDKLSSASVYVVSTQEQVPITSLWSADERVVLAFGRHMGLQRDIVPVLEAKGVKLYLITIGTPEKGVDFAAQTGFSPDRLLADPANACYEALQFRRGLRATFFNSATPAAIKKRQETPGGDQDLKDVLKSYKPLMPPKAEQALFQGGMLVFEGPRLLWAHYDEGTGAHADLDQVVQVATQGL